MTEDQIGKLGLSEATWARAEAAARRVAPSGVTLSTGGDRVSMLPPSATSRMEALARQQIAASLAGGIIAASGTPHTVEEARVVFRRVLEGMESIIAVSPAGA